MSAATFNESKLGAGTSYDAASTVGPDDMDVLTQLDVFVADLSRSMHLEDNVPNIQCANATLVVELVSPTNTWADHQGYFTTFGVEIDYIAQIETLTNRGTELISTLYTYRSVSQAIPEISMEIPKDSVMSPEEEAELAAKRSEINRKVLDVLRPEMKKLKEFIGFTVEATSLFHSCVTHLTSKEQHDELIPEGIYLSMVKLADVMLILDTLKDIKSCFKNDFSRYKRVVGSHPSIEILEEISQLQMFFSNPEPRKAKHYLFLCLRDEVRRVSGHEAVLLSLLDLALTSLDKGFYVTPEEKFRFLRILPFLMVMVDGEAQIDTEPKSFNVFKTSKIKATRLHAVFKKFPIVPLYGDMSITMEIILHRSSHYDRAAMGSQWGQKEADAAVASPPYDLRTAWDSMRSSYSHFTTRFAAAINRHRKYPFRKQLDDVTVDMSAATFGLAQEGLQLLSAWTAQLKQMLSWKYTHPCSLQHLQSIQVGANTQALEYGRVLRYNLSREELSVMVDFISMIKSLSALMHRSEALLSPYIRFHVHHRIQKLVLTDLVPLLHRVDKRNKPILPTLLKVRSLVADWGVEVASNAELQQQDYKSYSRNKPLPPTKHPARVVSTASTQLFILRTQVSSLFDHGSELKKASSWFGKADLEPADEQLFERFHSESFHFAYLLDFSQTLLQVSDLSDLWFREYFLEMTKCIQFPVDMSLPWMLTEHLLLKHVVNAPMMENVLFVLDIYNDAAYKALFVLNQQFLYDEIEAEANLVIDQLYFLLSDEVYSYYKNLAASTKLDKSLKNKLEGLKAGAAGSSSDHLTVESRRMVSLLSQRHIQLLGRTINFSFILGQNINNKVYRDIDFAIKRFESSDARGVVELKAFLDVLANTHARLCQYLELDPFPSMLSEVNESFSPACSRGRISLHMLSSLAKDVFPNSSYNLHTHRFVRSPIAIRPVQYGRAPKQSNITQAYGAVTSKEFEMCARLTRGFFGRPHIEAYIGLGPSCSDLSMLIDQCLKNLYDRIIDVKEYLEALKDGIPPCAPPKYLFKSIGAYGYYEGKLRSILAYDDLKPEVFQNFREIGNAIAFLRDLSDVLELHDQFDFMLIAPFLGTNVNDAVVGAGGAVVGEGGRSVSEASPLVRIVSHVSKVLADSKQLSAEVVAAQEVWSRVADMTRQLVGDRAAMQDSAGGGGGGAKSVRTGRSLIHWVLVQIEDFMYQEDLTVDWASNCRSSSSSFSTAPYHALSVQSAVGFHRLWSALSFLFCVVDDDDDDTTATAAEASPQSQLISNEAEFGHGFSIAGCTFIHLLGQRAVFEALDFSRYVLQIDLHEQRMKTVLGSSDPTSCDSSAVQQPGGGDKVHSLQQEAKGFVTAALTQQALQLELFSLLEAVHRSKDSYTEHSRSTTVFHPPAVTDS